MTKDAVTITDHRTGKAYEIELVEGALPALALRRIKTSEDDFGLISYDPGFANTAACKSRITYIDGEKGVLRYRGYPIDELAEESTFLEVAYLLLHGELPAEQELSEWTESITSHMLLHKSARKVVDGFVSGAHPMGILIAGVAALATLYPEAKEIRDAASRRRQIRRILGMMPALAACAFRHIAGLPYVDPEPGLSYAGNFLHRVFRHIRREAAPHPVLERALDVLFVLHADHEQNCSTNAMRGVASSLSDPYSSVAAAAAALSGPLHGGANEAVLRMLGEIGSKANIPPFIDRVKRGEVRLMGFGHRVYKNYDPRAKIIKRLAYEVFEVEGTNPLLEVALELERIALEDEYFVERKLYPNVDFYSGLIYQSMGFPASMFPVLFAVGRTAGWLAQWNEFAEDKEQRIARPRQIYLGPNLRHYSREGRGA